MRNKDEFENLVYVKCSAHRMKNRKQLAMTVLLSLSITLSITVSMASTKTRHEDYGYSTSPAAVSSSAKGSTPTDGQLDLPTEDASTQCNAEMPEADCAECYNIRITDNNGSELVCFTGAEYTEFINKIVSACETDKVSPESTDDSYYLNISANNGSPFAATVYEPKKIDLIKSLIEDRKKADK